MPGWAGKMDATMQTVRLRTKDVHCVDGARRVEAVSVEAMAEAVAAGYGASRFEG